LWWLVALVVAMLLAEVGEPVVSALALDFL
jgi:hypothetical protein